VKRFFFKLAILSGMLLGLPLWGVFIAGFPVARYLTFPPKTLYVQHEAFSWIVFAGLSVIILAAIFPFVLLFKWTKSPLERHFTSFPWWGWLGILFGCIAWIVAWNRFSWFSPWQPHTFTPLWLSYILVINALVYRRTGRCFMINHPRDFLLMFATSAVFWWFFEYLNRFVQNWYYVGVEFNAWEYFWYATLPFSTVLPALWSTQQWIGSWFHLENRYGHFPGIDRIHFHGFAWMILILSGAGLAGIGIWPDCLFPLLWVSPLLILISLQSLLGEPHIFSGEGCGKWHRVVSAALAALVCGFFWEMWNYFSLAKWEYAIPFVHRFQIFEMPILGYAGYLPFGVEGIVVGQMIEKV